MNRSRRQAKYLVVGAALGTAAYGAGTSPEPANYVLWALIFVAVLLDA